MATNGTATNGIHSAANGHATNGHAANGINATANGSYVNGHSHADGSPSYQNSSEPEPIAIIGIGARFPGGATDPHKLWDMLCAGRSAWSPIPKDRFNAEGFFHPNNERNGSMSVRGGYFLQDDLSLFDASFFNITPNEAKAIDPQQRLTLETTYEALENAGIPIENIAGSDTSVYVGCFNGDYAKLQANDPEMVPLYSSTGNAQSILSNRLSYFFDLKGPCMTIDTACSSSMVGLHLAVQSLRSGESSMSIVTGVNINIGPDMLIAMTLLRFLSEDGKCYTYDHRASGYARGEAAVSMIIKPLKDALRDGDPVRAVIRGTAVNQDGRTAGITLPSRDAQEALIRTAYRNAGLNPMDTAYFESHGTGTPAGDPLESGGIAATLGKGRPADKPVIVGSIKTNIGHTEGAAGLASLTKTVMILERGLIPPNLNFEKANDRIPLEEWGLKVPTSCMVWPDKNLRRASVNSFGFGGTNAHAIVDEWRPNRALFAQGLGDGNLVGGDGGDSGYHTPSGPQHPRKRLFLLSANDETAAKGWAKLLAEHLNEKKSLMLESPTYISDLAYTLFDRRSKLPWRAAVVASSKEDLASTLQDQLPKFIRNAKTPQLAFVFTGQGAQWFAMGRELLAAYPIYRQSIAAADVHLQKLGATWSLGDELAHDEEESRLELPFISQPACTALQLALVDLLAAWGIKPGSVTGHSSGEIAAAYAAGVLSFEDSVKVAFFRGQLSSMLPQRSDTEGAMLAVGVGPEAAEQHIAKSVTRGKVGVACVNSPSSVTVSGDLDAIDELCASLTAERIFARKLRVQVAYHSHHMRVIAADYEDSLKDIKVDASSPVQFFSSVTGHIIDKSELGASYWVRNMTSPVLFADSCAKMCLGEKAAVAKMGGGRRPVRRQAGAAAPDLLVEIGPHSALAGPIKQILAADAKLAKANIAYVSCLSRGNDAAQTALEAAGFLAARGYAIDFTPINFPASTEAASVPRKVLTDLPAYCWNHTGSYWWESHVSTNYRFRKFPRTDLLGAPVNDFNPTEPRWRGFIRTSENPWVKHHMVGRSILYPAAGMIIMALEAMRQLAVIASNPNPIDGFDFKDVVIGRAIVVPENADGVETMLQLRPLNWSARESSDRWQEFRVFSYTKTDGWVEHCRGHIAYKYSSAPTPIDGARAETHHQAQLASALESHRRDCRLQLDVNQLYENLESAGLRYGDTFRNITSIAGGPEMSFATVEVADIAPVMPKHFEYPYLIHPATLDSVIQAIFPALAPPEKPLTQPIVPTFFERIYVSNSISSTPGHKFAVWSDAQWTGFRNTKANFSMVEHDAADGSVRPLVEVTGLECAKLTEKMQTSDDSGPRKLCFKMQWGIDVDQLPEDNATTAKLFYKPPEVPEESAVISNLEEVSYYYIKDALDGLTDADVAQFESHQRALHNWMVYQNSAVENGTQENLEPHWINASATQKAKAIDFALAAGTVEGKMLTRVGAKLLAILRHEVDPLTLMLEDDLLYDLYREAIGTDRSYLQIADYVDKLGHKKPDLNILEIGSGTGGCTLPVLQKLAGDNSPYPRFSHYDFTDISPGFFEKAQENFKKWGGMMGFKKLNIEEDPVAQGFAEGTYDLIIAANVLHATKNMANTMTNVRRLLKPGGKLVLMEVTRQMLRVSLVFGTLPGWWLGVDEGRVLGPALNEAEWKDVLVRTGFSGLDICLRGYQDVREHQFSVIASSAVVPHPVNLPDIVVIGGDAGDAIASRVVATLEKETGRAPARFAVDQPNALPDLNGRIAVFLGELDNPMLPRPSAAEFATVQKVLASAKGVLWTTRGGAIEATVPEANMVAGLARAVRSENHALKLITLDMEKSAAAAATADIAVDVEADAANILRVFRTAFADVNENQGEDFEYAVRNGCVMVPRVVENTSMNAFIASDTAAPEPRLEKFDTPGRSLNLEIGTPGLLDTLRFVEDDLAVRGPLGNDEVEIEIRALGVNFRDVMVAMGQIVGNFLGCDSECSGVITQVGSKVKDLQIGDRITTWTLGAYGNVVRNPALMCQKIPDEMSFEVAASLPIAHCTVYYSFVDIAHLQPGETVLIHAAAGGVGQAAIMLAQHIGAEVFVTVGTADKKQLVMDQYGVPADHIFYSRDLSFVSGVMAATKGRGVDVILNSLTGELLRESWNCIAPFGRFIEIGKRDMYINSKLDMAPFIRNASFCSVDLTGLFRARVAVTARLLKDVMDLYRSRVIREVHPVTVFPISDIEGALRMMQAGKHTGKLVVCADPDCLVKVVPKVANPLRLRADASYLLVGGLGGLGRSMAKWMVQNGARNLIFLSRSGTDKAPAAKLVEELRDMGAACGVYKSDVGSPESLAEALAVADREMPPVAGIVHAGMLLQDSIFERMTLDQWEGAVNPKVHATNNLVDEFEKRSARRDGHPLDFFVILSSSAGVMGNSSQSNYAAGGTFEDATAHNHAARGRLPVVSIDLGLILGAGYVAENDATVGINLKKWGFLSIREAEFLAMVKSAMLDARRVPHENAQVITGLGTRAMVDANNRATGDDELPFWFYDTKFAHLLVIREAATASDEGEGAQNLPVALRAAETLDAAQRLVCDALVSKMSKVLMMNTDEVDNTQRMASYGVDSLVAVELRNWLFRETKVDIPVFELLGGHSLLELCGTVASRSSLVNEKLKAGTGDEEWISC